MSVGIPFGAGRAARTFRPREPSRPAARAAPGARYRPRAEWGRPPGQELGRRPLEERRYAARARDRRAGSSAVPLFGQASRPLLRAPRPLESRDEGAGEPLTERHGVGEEAPRLPGPEEQDRKKRLRRRFRTSGMAIFHTFAGWRAEGCVCEADPKPPFPTGGRRRTEPGPLASFLGPGRDAIPSRQVGRLPPRRPGSVPSPAAGAAATYLPRRIPHRVQGQGSSRVARVLCGAFRPWGRAAWDPASQTQPSARQLAKVWEDCHAMMGETSSSAAFVRSCSSGPGQGPRSFPSRRHGAR